MYYYLIYNADGSDAGALTCDTHLLSSETQVEVTKEVYDQWIADHPAPPPPEPDPEYISPQEAMQMIEEVL